MERECFQIQVSCGYYIKIHQTTPVPFSYLKKVVPKHNHFVNLFTGNVRERNKLNNTKRATSEIQNVGAYGTNNQISPTNQQYRNGSQP